MKKLYEFSVPIKGIDSISVEANSLNQAIELILEGDASVIRESADRDFDTDFNGNANDFLKSCFEE